MLSKIQFFWKIKYFSLYLYVWAYADEDCLHSWRSCRTPHTCVVSLQKHVPSYAHSMTMSGCMISHIFHRYTLVFHHLKTNYVVIFSSDWAVLIDFNPWWFICEYILQVTAIHIACGFLLKTEFLELKSTLTIIINFVPWPEITCKFKT